MAKQILQDNVTALVKMHGDTFKFDSNQPDELLSYCIVGSASQHSIWTMFHRFQNLDSNTRKRLRIPGCLRKSDRDFEAVFNIRQIVNVGCDPSGVDRKVVEECVRSTPVDSAMIRTLEEAAVHLTKMYGRLSEPIVMTYKRSSDEYYWPSITYDVRFDTKIRLLLVLLMGTHRRNKDSPIFKMSLMNHFEPQVFRIIRSLLYSPGN